MSCMVWQSQVNISCIFVLVTEDYENVSQDCGNVAVDSFQNLTSTIFFQAGLGQTFDRVPPNGLANYACVQLLHGV